MSEEETLFEAKKHSILSRDSEFSLKLSKNNKNKEHSKPCGTISQGTLNSSSGISGEGLNLRIVI